MAKFKTLKKLASVFQKVMPKKKDGKKGIKGWLSAMLPNSMPSLGFLLSLGASGMSAEAMQENNKKKKRPNPKK